MNAGNFFTILYYIGWIRKGYCQLEFISQTKSCLTNIDDTWQVYKRHFSSARTIIVTILKTEIHENELIDFSEELIKLLNEYCKLNKTLIINRRALKTYDRMNSNEDYNLRFRDTSKIKYKHVNFDKIKQVERFSSNPEEAYLLIAWDEEVLGQFLDFEPYKALAKTRATHVIFFMFSSPGSCEIYYKGIGNILARLWHSFNVLNVIAQAPCSCDSDNIYIYKPFQTLGTNVWGTIDVHVVKQVLEFPYVITNALLDLNNFPVKISMFPRTPTAMLNLPNSMVSNPIYKAAKRSTGFYGVDANVLSGLATYLHFQINNTNNTQNDFGYVVNPGNITGSLGQVVRKEVHLSANGRFLNYYYTDEIEFTVPFSNDRLCIVVPKSARIPQWMVLFVCFKWQVWLCNLVILIVCTIVWYFLKKLHDDNLNELNNVWLEIWAIFISVPVSIRASNRGRGYFLASFMVFNVIIMGIFQGSLFKSYSTVSYYADIDNLQDLDDSGLTISTSLNIFNENQSKLFYRLKHKTIQNQQSKYSLDLAAYDRTVAAVERKLDARLFLQTKYLSEDGLPLLHIVNECPVTYFVTYIVPKGSPFLPRFNTIITKYMESGLANKWYNDIVDTIVMVKKFKTPENEQIQKPFSFADVQTGFLILISGYLLSLLVFFVEIIQKKTKQNFLSENLKQ